MVIGVLLSILLVVLGESTTSLVLEVISVSDTHGWIYGHKHEPILGDYGTLVSYIDHAREAVEKEPSHSLLVIDGGDLIEGTGLSDATPIKGMYIYQAASEVQFDVITVGNHDLGSESSTKYIHEEIDKLFQGSYISSNVFMKEDNSPLVKNRFKQQTLPNGLNVLMFGFLYHSSYVMSYAHRASEIITSKEMIKLLDEQFNKTDVLVVVNHISSTDHELKEIVSAFRSYYDARGYTIPIIMISAHSHRLYNKTCPFDPTEQCFIVEAECYLKRIQHVKYTLEPFHYIDLQTGSQRVGYQLSTSPEVLPFSSNVVLTLAHRFGLTPSTFDTPRGIALRNKIRGWVDSLNLQRVLGCSKYFYSKSKGVDLPDSIFNLWLNAVMPSEAFSSSRMNICVQFPMVGSSSVRDSIYEGEFVLDDAYNIMPFSNSLVYIPNLTSEEVACAFSGISYLYSEEEQRHNVYAYEATRDSIPRYVTPSDPTSLLSENCYDLLLTSYDAERFAPYFKEGGKCFSIINISKSYDAIPYPSEPLADVTTVQLLPMFFSNYMPCSDVHFSGNSLFKPMDFSVVTSIRIAFYILSSLVLIAITMAIIGFCVFFHKHNKIVRELS